MKIKTKKKKIRLLFIIDISLFIVFISLFIIEMGIKVGKGEITNRMWNDYYPEGSLVFAQTKKEGYISYCEFSGTIEEINRRYGMNIELGDKVVVIYIGSPDLVVPEAIKVIWIFAVGE